MNLVIDIGNTHTKLAWFEQGRLIEMVRAEENGMKKIVSIIREKKAPHTILSSVGSMDTALKSALDQVKTDLLLLDHHTPLPLDVSYDTPETLGYDRIAAAAGAMYVCPYCNVMIADIGTAITIDFITAEGLFLGGNISPGMHTRFRSLHEYTSKLPLVVKDSAFPEFGTDTRTAIVAGVQRGIIFEINGYIDEFAHKYAACEFIITGGDAAFFVSKLKRSIFAIPDLVLKGLNYILEYNTTGIKP